ncbi:hypothetical protein ACHOLT_04765 [Desulfitobacterium sp. Sab5]|uniref:hypothetical protein n=1 Tax=Desulfitobacterium nosdiversum TaxID=3375356 RepID=UPI003CEB95D8
MMRPYNVRVEGPTFTNTAKVSSTDQSILCGTVDSQDSQNSIILAASEALTITKTGLPAELCAGGVLIYTLTIRNTSASTKTFNLTDTIVASPSGTILPGDVTTNPSDSIKTQITNGLEIKWSDITIPGKNTPGNPNAENGYYELTYTIFLTTTCGIVGTISNNAQIDFSGSTIPSNEVSTLVKAVVDLSILKTKISPKDPVYVGDTIEYNITVTNNGPCDATGVYVDDILPATATIVPDPNWVLQGGTTYRYTIGTLAAGATINISLKVVPTAPTNL